MNTNVRTIASVRGWAAAFVATVGLWDAAPTSASPVQFSTSGRYDLAAGSGELAGVTGAASADNILIGTVPVDGVVGPLGDAGFQVQFRFNNDLPPITVSGTAPSIGYSPDLPALDTVVTTSATSGQLGLYPELFQKLLTHPDWLHTTAFRSDQVPMMSVFLSVHPEDPGAIRPVPEPSSLVIVATTLAGLGWRVHRRRRAVGR